MPSEKPVELALPKRETIEGTVVDTSGKPVGNLRVTLVLVVDRASAPPFFTNAGEAKVEADGTFKATGLFPGTYKIVVFDLGSTGLHAEEIEAKTGATDVRLLMKPSP